MDKHQIEQIYDEAAKAGLLRFSSDAKADGYENAHYVPVNKVHEFIAFVASHELVCLNAAKPFVGKVLGLQRHKTMRVFKLNMGYYPIPVDSNKLFPTAVLIIDENDTHLQCLGNDNLKYWIKRYYFTGPVTEDGTIPQKKKK